GQRFDVVDDGRAAVEADGGGKGRLDARIAALPLERLEKCRFLAADVRPGPPINNDIEAEAAPQNVLAEETPGTGLLHRLLEGPIPLVEFAPDIEEGEIRLDGVGREDDPLQDQVRILFDQETVLERAGLALIGVDAEVARLVFGLRQEAPFHPGREPGAAAAAQARRLHLLEQLRGRELLQGTPQSLVASRGEVRVDRLRGGLVDIARQDRLEGHVPRSSPFRISSIFAASTGPCSASLIWMNGALSHAPRHSTETSEQTPSARVSPSSIRRRVLRCAISSSAPRRAQGSVRQTWM